MTQKFRIGASLLALGVVTTGAARAEIPVTQSLSFYGSPGLIEMPTAESAPDANFTASFTAFGKINRTALHFQISPRFSGTFRYSRIGGYNVDGTDRLDRSFDLQYLLLKEGRYHPAVAFGLRDFAGTGLWSSEYVVATKTINPKITVTAGLGWGRLGSNGTIATFGDRTNEYVPTGGTVSFGKYFQGDVAPFAGISYQPNKRLTLKAEYSSDAYFVEEQRGVIDVQSPWNFNAEYKFDSGTALSASYLYGTEIGVQLRIALNPKKPFVTSAEAAPLPVERRPSRRISPADWGQEWTEEPNATGILSDRIADVLAKDGIVVEAMAVNGTRAEVRVRNTRFAALPQAIGRSARVMSRALPASVETLVIVPVVDGIPLSRVSISRSDLENLENAHSGEILARAAITDAAGPKLDGARINPEVYPKFTWSLKPYVRVGYFDPDEPIRGDVGLRLSGKYDIAPGWVLQGAIRKKAFGNLDENSVTTNSVLPHVRTDYILYNQNADPAIDDLTLAYFGRPGRNLYSRVTVGYLERMFGGISGELLWKPVDSRLALGAEVNIVKQRDFEQMFGFQDYEVVTGHASAYYDFGKGYHGQLDVGRYLAGDWGTTITLDREFANGWRVGAFATFTDVSFEDFGEGSFDKGLRIQVPVSFFTGKPSTQKVGGVLRPLTRDGGARLNVEGRLYESVREAHQPELAKTWGRFWK
ncbi:YjbH domain-containing protein [Alphaproteobacteria bacterium KMM 3653]|uniref:YjbH domain-containing protein n=1 Tax=Harenicola maris TaxID=2841044 RepID=A0AAP2CNP5_9RHOB|nr:YjbH domain-containing protein [Harenicola maris]